MKTDEIDRILSELGRTFQEKKTHYIVYESKVLNPVIEVTPPDSSTH